MSTDYSKVITDIWASLKALIVNIGVALVTYLGTMSKVNQKSTDAVLEGVKKKERRRKEIKKLTNEELAKNTVDDSIGT
jgi:hypothetical protein